MMKRMDGVCRCCLKDGSLKSILKVDRKETVTYLEMMKECISFMVEENDILPTTICSKCIHQLKCSYLFRLKCIETKKQFEDNVENNKLDIDLNLDDNVKEEIDHFDDVLPDADDCLMDDKEDIKIEMKLEESIPEDIGYDNIPYDNASLEKENEACEFIKQYFKEDKNVLRIANVKSHEAEKNQKHPKTQRKKSISAHMRQREKANARKRKFLDQMTEVEKEIKRAKDRAYYQKKKAEKKVKNIAEMAEREKRKQRNIWMEASKKYREKKKAL